MKLLKGRLGNIRFQYNPSSIEYTGGRSWLNITSAGMKPIPTSGGFLPQTLSFELMFTGRSFEPVEIDQIFKQLVAYRESAEPVAFIFGSSVAVYAYVIDCPIRMEAFNRNLALLEFKVPITLQIKEG